MGLPKKLLAVLSSLCSNYFLSLFSHAWLAIPQLVLQADWQDVWHSPQPPFFALSQRLLVFIVLMCSILKNLRLSDYEEIISHKFSKVNTNFKKKSKRNNQKYIDFIKKVCYNSRVNNFERIFLCQIRRKITTMLLKKRQ